MNDQQTLPPNPKKEIEQLCKLDPAFIPLAKAHSPFPLPVREFTFDLFISSIIGQSISTKAASTIKKRLRAELSEGYTVKVEQVLQRTPEQLRDLGLSNAKAKAICDLAQLWEAEKLNGANWSEWSNKKLMDFFTAVPGVGPWTVKMIMIFGLRRADVFPEGDLGVRMGIQKLRGLAERPSQQEARTISLQWQPYRTLATVYLWQSLLVENNSSLNETNVWWSPQTTQPKERP